MCAVSLCMKGFIWRKLSVHFKGSNIPSFGLSAWHTSFGIAVGDFANPYAGAIVGVERGFRRCISRNNLSCTANHAVLPVVFHPRQMRGLRQVSSSIVLVPL